MPVATLPGAQGTPVTLPGATGTSASDFAAQLGAGLAATPQLLVTSNSISGDTTLPSTGDRPTEAVLSGDASGTISVPNTYAAVVETGTAPVTISASGNTSVITGTVGGAVFTTGNNSVVATGGNNVLAGSGTSFFVTGSGNNTLNSYAGTGTLEGGTGQNLMFAFGTSGLVESTGQDTVDVGSGATTVQSSGADLLLYGNFTSTPGTLRYRYLRRSSYRVGRPRQCRCHPRGRQRFALRRNSQTKRAHSPSSTAARTTPSRPAIAGQT